MISFYHINDKCVLKTCHVNPNWHFVIASTKVILKKKKKEFSSMRSAGKKEASFANYNLASISVNGPSEAAVSLVLWHLPFVSWLR